jgi:hypothetical protein
MGIHRINHFMGKICRQCGRSLVRPAPDAILRRIRFGRGLNGVFAWAQGQVVGYDINTHHGEHEDDREPHTPISMRVLPEFSARVRVIPGLGSFAFHIVFMRAHLVPLRLAADHLDISGALGKLHAL